MFSEGLAVVVNVTLPIVNTGAGVPHHCVGLGRCIVWGAVIPGIPLVMYWVCVGCATVILVITGGINYRLFISSGVRK
jgi:hypothetical protein